MKDFCPSCNSNNIEKIQENYTFFYGAGKYPVSLTALVPIIKCFNCHSKFLDHVAQSLCHETVCKYLGVMVPAQIQSLREELAFTQDEFAEFTGITKTKLSKWEEGIEIQSKAYDNFLYLLSFEDNFQRLIDKAGKEK